MPEVIAREQSEGRTSLFVTVDGVQFHALDWGGDGPPLLLVHGGRRTGRSWNAVSRRLRNDFRVIALDTRGHGESDAPETGYRATEGARDLAGIVEELDLPPHYILSHSYGGAISGLYATNHPDRVLGMVMVEPVPEGPAHWVRVNVLNEDLTEKPGPGRRNSWSSLDDLKSRLQNNNMTSVWTPEALDDVLKEETIVLPDGRAEAAWSLNAYNMDELATDHFLLIDGADRLTMPILVVVAAENNLLESHQRPLAEALPHGEFLVMPDVGHAIYMQVPDETANIARRFLLASRD